MRDGNHRDGHCVAESDWPVVAARHICGAQHIILVVHHDSGNCPCLLCVQSLLHEARAALLGVFRIAVHEGDLAAHGVAVAERSVRKTRLGGNEPAVRDLLPAAAHTNAHP
jgi:hypothetical protein